MSELSNPYAAPTSVADETSLGAENFVRATQGQRVANYVVDWITSRFIDFGFTLLLDFTGILGPSYAIGNLEAFFLTIGLILAYYITMEATCGRTLGKLVTGTKVVDQNGRSPTLRQVVIRSLTRLIPFEPFSFLGKSAYGWHDSFSKTYVVKA